MNSVLSELLETRRVVTRTGSTIALEDEIAPETGALLQRLIRERKPRVTLEVGCAYGISTLYICEALAEVGGTKHIVIDPVQDTDWQGAGLYAVERAGFSGLVEFHRQPSHRALPALAARGERIEVAFVDGFHTFDYALVDFFYIDLMLKVGGYAVLDDTSFPAIRKVTRYIATHRHYEPLADETEAAGGLLQAAMRIDPVRRLARRALRPDVLQPDASIGLPHGNCIAFRKVADDEPGNHVRGNRPFDQHHDF